MTETVLIQHIGLQEPRIDNISPASGRVWLKTGDALPVPVAEKYRYLAHPMSFREISDEDYLAAKEITDRDVESFAEHIKGVSRDTLLKLKPLLDAEIAIRKLEPVAAPLPVIVPVTALTAGDVANATDPAVMQVYKERIDKIVVAIKNMDLKDDSLAVNGRPKAQAIKDFVGGELPSEDDITEALAVVTGIREPAAPVDGEEPKKLELTPRDKAVLALGELDLADRATLEQMASVFEVTFSARIGDDTLRERIRDVLIGLTT